jgi:hypothetical protein
VVVQNTIMSFRLHERRAVPSTADIGAAHATAMKEWLLSFLNSALNVGELSSSCNGRFTHEERSAGTRCIGRLVRPREGLRAVGAAENRRWIVQPAAVAIPPMQSRLHLQFIYPNFQNRLHMQ